MFCVFLITTLFDDKWVRSHFKKASSLKYIVCKMKTKRTSLEKYCNKVVVIGYFCYIKIQDQQPGQQIMVSLWKASKAFQLSLFGALMELNRLEDESV